MNIRNIFSEIKHQDITEKYIQQLKKDKKSLTKAEKKYLSKIIEKYKIYNIDDILKAIKIYAIWEPDESIEIARKKGAFRYKGYKLENNYVLYLLNELSACGNLFCISKDTINYLETKKNISWLFDFYKDSEQKIIKYIKDQHRIRNKIKVGKQDVESAVFKDLLAYIDASFYLNKYDSNENYLDKDKLDGYCKEAICNAISYIIFLYDSAIGIKKEINYYTNSNYVLSNKLEPIILTACKVIEMQEWELCIDYFNYKLENHDNNIHIISCGNRSLEKSIRLGYYKIESQKQIFPSRLNELTEEIDSIENRSNAIIDKLSKKLIEEINVGLLSRYIFKFPTELFKIFVDDERKLFKEELIASEYIAKELIMTSEEACDKKITEHCTLEDVLVFQRVFLIINDIASKILFRKDDMKKIINSLIPAFKKEILLSMINIFIKDTEKTKELLELFSYRKSNKLDLQYTPFLSMSDYIVFPNTIVAKTNLLRNCIAHSYSIKNEIVNDDQGLEPLVNVCSDIFKRCSMDYMVLTNKKFKYNGNDGEIDVIIVSEEDIILIECKCPLAPVNNFEMRSSFEHIRKANKQLNLSKLAFSDKGFRNNYLKSWGIKYKGQNIRTCIVFGNRLFSGYNCLEHPIRYIYELDTVLNTGRIRSEFGEWNLWEEDTFSHDDLIKFLSETDSLCNLNFKAMESISMKMMVLDKKVVFNTYAYNIKEAIKIYDSNFNIISSNDELKEKYLYVKNQLEQE
ncbi:hypothetical protein FC959_03450 [Clostridium botulinum]|nr:hypothetical protein [Clostridium botulinum]